ncbi:unnamed protein product [Caenorhabditis sp. 36 PRJEB53466]|nr:unnamed protein product [Caenorhabditis sp. 36 PRJEB53466]
MRKAAVVEKDWILQKPLECFIEDEVDLKRGQSAQLCHLFKQGCESAYIARYRGDVHGGLPPEEIRKAMEAYYNAVDLNKKVSSALTTLTAKVEGVSEKKVVAERLKNCEDMQEVGEISKEFSTGTRKTKASIARELGLELPAKLILDRQFVDSKSFISNQMKKEKDVKEHLKICLADLMNRHEDVKKVAAKIAKLEIRAGGLKVEAKLSKEAAKKKESQAMEAHLNKYKDYIGKSWSAHGIRDHQVSALNRASEEGILTWSASLPLGDAKRFHPFANCPVHPGMLGFFQESLTYSINTYFIPKVERAAKKFLTEKAISRSIILFGENVEQLFAQQGIHEKYVIALDPGSVVKTAFLKPSGAVIAMDEFGINNKNFNRKGVELLKKWTAQTEGKGIVFAVGNGSNTYNTQCAVSSMIENREFPPGIEVTFCVVPEHGASKYSCTPAAQEEFGGKADIKQISAVSIGRRLIDPMSEYVKIEPQHLGKGQYQLSVDEKQLKQKLALVIRDRVSLIGADLNQASKHLLQHICGLKTATAAGIVKYREEHGEFKARDELKKVKGIGAVAFQQCAGFLTVSNPSPDSAEPPTKRSKLSNEKVKWCPLDGTIVHPEDYGTAQKMLKKLNMSVEEIVNGKSVPSVTLTPEETKILELLTTKPDLKPPPPQMKRARAMRDLQIGQRFTGVVANKTDFGVFVDIGVENDGLVHISCFRNGHRSGPPERDLLPHVGDVIEVVIDRLNNNKIALKPAH